jgi:hypothetical protein
MYTIWLISALAGVICCNGFAEFKQVKCVCVCVCAALLIATVGLVAMELPYRRAPELIIPPPAATIYVLGDSISAGMRKGGSNMA